MLAVLLTAIAILVAVALLTLSDGAADDAQPTIAPGAPAPPQQPAAPDGGSSRGLRSAPAPLAPAGERHEAPVDDAAVRRPGRITGDPFAGRGTIRGSVEPPQGRSLPETWSLRVGPSLFLPGREHAEERTVEMSAPSGEFRIEDVPLGGYSVEVVAEGMNCPAVQVGLDRFNDSPYVTLALSAAGYIQGSVVDELGGLVEGLDVWLAGERSASRTSVTTDASGTYVFERVLDGRYEIFYGHPDNPIAPPRKIAFQAPAMHLPPREVPALATLDVRVLDEFAVPVPEATVRGTGNMGGHFTLETDERGEVRARFLPPGRYRVHAMHAERGNMSEQVELEKGRTESLEILLRR